MTESLTETICAALYGATLVLIVVTLTYASATYFPYNLFFNQGAL